MVLIRIEYCVNPEAIELIAEHPIFELSENHSMIQIIPKANDFHANIDLLNGKTKIVVHMLSEYFETIFVQREKIMFVGNYSSLSESGVRDWKTIIPTIKSIMISNLSVFFSSEILYRR